MKIDANEDSIQKVHEEVLAEAEQGGAGDGFIRMSKRCVDGHWKRYIVKLELFSKSLQGAVFLDYGCKFGHLTPLLVDQKIKNTYAVDVSDNYLRDGSEFFGERFPVEYVKSQDCFIAVPSNSVDLLLANEVISHINPSFLDTFYSEAARVLKPGGEMVISDGNNWAHLKTRIDLLEWYSLWENGTSKEFKDRNYATRRREFISSKFPDLDEQTVQYLALNTSGLWGDQVLDAVNAFRSGQGFVPRPYRPGVYPTHPVAGWLMERAFDPRQVIIALETYGIDAVQLLRGQPLHDDSKRGATKNFTLRGTKMPEDIAALAEHARQTVSSPDQMSSAKFGDKDLELIGVAEFLARVKGQEGKGMRKARRVLQTFLPALPIESHVADVVEQLKTRKKLAEQGGRKDRARELAKALKALS